jgi:hypothetical protein
VRRVGTCVCVGVLTPGERAWQPQEQPELTLGVFVGASEPPAGPGTGPNMHVVHPYIDRGHATVLLRHMCWVLIWSWLVPLAVHSVTCAMNIRCTAVCQELGLACDTDVTVTPLCLGPVRSLAVAMGGGGARCVVP